METKLYKSIHKDGSQIPFLVFQVTSEISDLEKFTGGTVESLNGKFTLNTRKGSRRVDIGDFVVYLTESSPFTNIRIQLDKVRHSLPKESFLVCKPDEFLRNFQEV